MKKKEFIAYPMIFSEIFKAKPWGGRRLTSLLGKKMPPKQPMGESWELADVGKDQSICLAGPFKGMSLRQIYSSWPEEIGGRTCRGKRDERFPVLVKFIDARSNLSVQVHPGDAWAKKHENGSPGKTEMWVILDALPSARLIAGLKKGVSRTAMKKAVTDGQTEKMLNSFAVRPGDAIFIPAGRVHAIPAGVVLCEIQQSSDITYRIHDWGRVGFDGKPRQLHIDQALKVIDYKNTQPNKIRTKSTRRKNNVFTLILKTKIFTVSSMALENDHKDNTLDSFAALITLKGRIRVNWAAGHTILGKGRTMLLPAALGAYQIHPLGQASILKVTL